MTPYDVFAEATVYIHGDEYVIDVYSQVEAESMEDARRVFLENCECKSQGRDVCEIKEVHGDEDEEPWSSED